MKCREIVEALKKKWPEEYAMEWDNVGLLVGDMDQKVNRIFVALDVTDDNLSQAIEEKADMIITHHPLMFSPLRKVVAQDFIGRRVLEMAKHNICYYAMHTNFDVMGMGNLNASSLNLEFPTALEVTHVDENGAKEGIGRVGTLHHAMPLKEFGVYAKEHLGLSMVRVYGDEDKRIEKVAISSGSGKGMTQAALAAGADVLVTGDVDYHMGIDAVAQNLAVVDGGHYGTEMIFIDYMEETLREMLPDMTITSAKIKQPFGLV